MALFNRSNKIKSKKPQWKIVAGDFVLLRVLRNEDNTYWVWTATAAEWDRSHRAFPDQARLMDIAEIEIGKIGVKVEPNADGLNRPYLEFHDVDDPIALQNVANRMANMLGLDPATCQWIDAEARQELKDLWSDLAVDDDEDAYLSDGVYVSKDGKLSGLGS